MELQMAKVGWGELNPHALMLEVRKMRIAFKGAWEGVAGEVSTSRSSWQSNLSNCVTVMGVQ